MCVFIRSFVRLLCVLANVIIVFVYVFHESCATALVGIRLCFHFFLTFYEIVFLVAFVVGDGGGIRVASSCNDLDIVDDADEGVVIIIVSSNIPSL